MRLTKLDIKTKDGRFWVMVLSWFSIPALIPLLRHFNLSITGIFVLTLVYGLVLTTLMSTWIDRIKEDDEDSIS